MNPACPSVVSGDSASFGRRSMNDAATLIAFTIRPFAYPGWVLKPWKVMVIASAEKLSTSISPRLPPSMVYAQAAPKRATSKCRVPRPISSSGVKAIRMRPCGISGCATRYAAAVTISATPALSSAPRSVLPDAAPRHLWRRVYVRDEADGRDAAFRGRSGNGRHHVAEGVDVSVRETEVA